MRPGNFLVLTAFSVLTHSLPALAEPDFWDPRLDMFCGLEVVDVSSQVTPGQGYWRLTEGHFEDEAEAGGNHVIFIKALNASGQPITGQKVFQSWPYNNLTINEAQCTSSNWACAETKAGGIDDYWGNLAIWGGCPSDNCDGQYNAWVSETTSPVGLVGRSDKVIGMWMHDPQPGHTPCNAHVNFRLLYQWTIATSPEPPEMQVTPTLIQAAAEQGVNPPNSGFTVRNVGGDSLNYTINESISWLSVSPSSGSSNGETDVISVIYNTASLSPATYEGTISVIDPSATNSPRTVTVQLTVNVPTAPGDHDLDGDVDQEDFGMFQRCRTGGGVVQSRPECQFADLDDDHDVDHDDYGLFESCMTGANIPADINCVP